MCHNRPQPDTDRSVGVCFLCSLTERPSRPELLRCITSELNPCDARLPRASHEPVDGDCDRLRRFPPDLRDFLVHGISKEIPDRLSTREAKDHQPMRLPVALDDLVVPAPGQVLATVLCDEGRRLLSVFLIGGRIVDIDVDDHVGGHGSSPMFASASCSALDYLRR